MSDATELKIWTVGHSTRSLDELLQLLFKNRIEAVADVRSLPGSRKFPHFNAEELQLSLPVHRIEFVPFKLLGGRRKVRPDSPHTVWRHKAFRGYADYMDTEEFKRGIQTRNCNAARAGEPNANSRHVCRSCLVALSSFDDRGLSKIARRHGRTHYWSERECRSPIYIGCEHRERTIGVRSRIEMEIVGWIGTALVIAAYYPQIRHLYVEKCAWGISLATWWIWLVSSAFLLTYALLDGSTLFVWSRRSICLRSWSRSSSPKEAITFAPITCSVRRNR
jgi:uncharacterized protein with PQ loop repeat